jgi:lipopolysaccharide export system permease protein
MIFALYLTRVFLLSAGAAFLALGALAELLDLLDNGNTVIAQHGRIADLAYYAALISPTIGASVIPIATLVGALVTFGNLAGNNEIVAMRSSGMTLYWVVSHLAPAVLVIGLLYFGLRYIVAPYTEIQVYEMLREHPTADAAAGQNAENGAPAAGAYWIGSGPLLLAFETVENEGRVIRNITLFSRDKNARMVRHLRANMGTFGDDVWRFDGVTSQNIGASGEVRKADDTFILSDGPQPIDILAATIPNARVRLSAPGIGAANIWAGGGSPASRRTNFYEATAAPFVPLIMLLAAAPLALGTARQPSRARDLSIALCAGFGYLLTSGVFRSLGESGVMPALLAVWGPVIIFALAAASILAHREG